MAVLKPPHLKAEDTLALVAPAFHFDPDLFKLGQRYIQQQYKIKTTHLSSITEKEGYFAGSRDRRCDELFKWLTDPKVQGILGIRGGYGCATFYGDLIKQLRKQKKLKPKIVIGFSDLTILLNGLFQDLGWVTFHGPMVVGRPFREPVALELDSFKKNLFSTKPWGNVSVPEMITLQEGSTQGVLVGGCLSLLASSLGTPYEVDTNNKIVFIEDIGEAPFRVDRMLTQLIQAGKFKKARGIVFGQMTNCQPHTPAYADTDVLTAIKMALEPLNLPTIYNFPGGHGSPQMTFPLGVKVKLRAPQHEPPTLTFLESGVR